jgi:hypothetical protein
MTRWTYLSLIAWLVLAAPGRPAEPKHAAPLYSLPADGTWVEFEWTATRPSGPDLHGTLRLSAVGGKVISGTAYRWVEIRQEYPADVGTKQQYRKLLIDAKAFVASATLRDHVRTVIGQDGPAAPFLLSPTRAEDFLDLGLGLAEAALTEVRAGEKVRTPLGEHTARQVTAGGASRGHTWEYRGWLTADVPFGCARFEVRKGEGDGPLRTVFTATAARAGRGATAEVDESRAR